MCEREREKREKRQRDREIEKSESEWASIWYFEVGRIVIAEVLDHGTRREALSRRKIVHTQTPTHAYTKKHTSVC